MITSQQFREFALSFAEAIEQPHFGNTSFRVNKKIYATLDERINRAVLKFNEIDQSVFCEIDKSVIHALPNKWGKQGWTYIELDNIENELLMDALTTAYKTVAPKNLGDLYNYDF